MREILREANFDRALVVMEILVLIAQVIPSSYAQVNTIFEDDFSELNLNKWDSFGSPSPRILESIKGRSAVFDNNGDSNYDSGATSKEVFSFPDGFVIESDIYLDATNPSGCWADAEIGLITPGSNVYTGPFELYFKIRYIGDACWGDPADKRRHAYIEGGFYTENSNWETIGNWINGDVYNNGWHNFKVVVSDDRFVKYYIDDILIYSSVNRIDSEALLNEKVIISGRSSGSAGKAYHDDIKITSGQVDPYDYVIFKNVDLIPKSGSILQANKNAELILTVENTGSANIPASKWNTVTTFYDLYGVGSDLLETMWKRQTCIVQTRELQVDFPDLPPGETTIAIPVSLNMRDPINYKDQYMAYADGLLICGNPVPRDADCTKRQTSKQIYIASNLAEDEARCLWGIAQICLEACLPLMGDLDVQRCTKFLFDVGELTIDVFVDGAFGLKEATNYIVSVINLLLDLADIILQGNRVIEIINIISAVEELAGIAGECISTINAFLAEITSIWIDLGDLYQLIIIEWGSEIKIVNAAGEMIYMNGSEISNQIPGSSAFYLAHEEVILIPGDGNLSIWIMGTNSSVMEVTSVAPIGNNNPVYEHFSIPVINGTILTSDYTKFMGFGPFKVDYDGNGIFDYVAYPDKTQSRIYIAGKKYKDINGNGPKDGNDSIIAGWPIRLTKPDGSSIITNTDNNGTYVFKNLTGGIYKVDELQLEGWVQTYPKNEFYEVTITGSNVTRLDFGNCLISKQNIQNIEIGTQTSYGNDFGIATNIVNISSEQYELQTETNAEMISIGNQSTISFGRSTSTNTVNVISNQYY